MRPVPRWLLACCALLWFGTVAGGCAHHEKRMVSRVEWYLEANRHYDALDYLETYLDRYPTSERAWRYRVHIRLGMDQRPQAAAEYWRLRTALGVHHLDALAQVVTAGGAGWTLPEFFALSRCGTDGLGDLAFFEQTLLGHPIGQDGNIVLTPPTETVLGVMRVLPGRFGADALPLIDEGQAHGSDEVRLAAAEAAMRLAAEGHDAGRQIRKGCTDPSPRVRRGVIEASLWHPEITLDPAECGLAEETDGTVAVAWLGVLPGGAEADELRTQIAAVAPQAAALTGVRSLAPRTKGDPALALAVKVGKGQCDERAWSGNTTDLRRDLATLAAPFVPLTPEILALWAADPDPVVRTAAARYLVHGLDQPPLLALLSDPEQGVRAAAAAALVAGGDPAAANHLTSYLPRAGLEEKLSLVDALLRHQPHPYGVVAQQLSADATSLVREAAYPAVAAECRDDHEALFMQGLTDDDPHVVVRAAAALYLAASRIAAAAPASPAPAQAPE